MALTLHIEGKSLSAADFRTTLPAGDVVPGEPFVMDEVLREVLTLTSVELQEIRRQVACEGHDRPRRRLLYRDSLQQMEEKGLLGAEQVRAGREIAQIYEMLMSVGRSGVGAYAEMVTLATGDLIPASFGVAVTTRYLPWKTWAQERYTNPGHAKTIFDLTVLVCVDGYGKRQAADHLHMDHRRLMRLLQESLWRYCVIAGWVDDGPAEAEAASAELGEGFRRLLDVVEVPA